MLTGKTEKKAYSEENLFQCHFVDNKSRIVWSGIELGISRGEAGN